ncbi:MAG: hypothetical protein IT477_10770, partial [Rhodanobacteraceae bacterium]|nr:hypothetical protein [Rhodanobacteraceae bacterium]
MVAELVDQRPELYRVEQDDAGRHNLRVSFHPGQLKAWDSRKRFVVVLAGSQGGKTSFGPFWLWREIQERGPGDYGVVTPTFPLLELKALPEFRRLFEETLNLGRYVGNPVRRFTVSAEGEIRLFGQRQRTPTHVYFGHAQDPDSLESATFKGVWADEVGQRKFQYGSWAALRRRTTLHRARVLFTTTPYVLGWLKTEFYDAWEATGRNHPTIDIINFASTMNPMFSEEEFEELRLSMPPWQFEMFHLGRFTRPAGLIYDCFSD